MEAIAYTTLPVLALAAAGYYLGRYEAKIFYRKGRPRFGAATRKVTALVIVGLFAVMLFGSVVGKEGMLVLGVGDGNVFSPRIVSSPENLERMLIGLCGVVTCAAYHIAYARGAARMRKKIVISYLEE